METVAMKHRWIGLCLALALAVGCSSEPALVRQIHKEQLISTIRQKLLESVEAEKIAVLARTDEESQAAALDARNEAAAVNTVRSELRQLVVADGRRGEIEKLDAFDTTWTELEHIDERLLALAVANTNLKATRLLSREGAATLDRFVDGLTALQRSVTDPELIRTLAQAAVAAQRSQALLFVHIPAADDTEMTHLEERMHDLSTEVERCLSSARENGQVGPEALASTAQAWSEYQRLAADVVRLSRQNTNVLSFDVSIHEKRQATKDCLSALSALSAAVNAGPDATR
jgi:methyl-accepting chemotaxis protein